VLVGGEPLRTVVVEVLGWFGPALPGLALISVALLVVAFRLRLAFGEVSRLRLRILRLRIRYAVPAGRGRAVGSHRSSMGICVSMGVGWIFVTAEVDVVDRIRKIINVAAAGR
jgi:hypothetical protein